MPWSQVVQLMIVLSLAISVSSFNSDTWQDVDDCYKKVDDVCREKLPDTPPRERRCYENRTVQDAFEEAAAPFEQCIDEHLHTGESCVRLRPRPPKHPQRPFTKCWNDERNHCTEGCQELQGPKIRDYLSCSKAAFKRAHDLWQQCVGHHPGGKYSNRGKKDRYNRKILRQQILAAPRKFSNLPIADAMDELPYPFELV